MGCAGGLGDPGSRVSLRDGSPVVVRGLVGAFHYLSIYLFIAICRPPPGARAGQPCMHASRPGSRIAATHLWSRVKKSKYTSAFRFSRPDATRHDTGPLLTIIPKPQPQHDPSQGGPTDRVDNELLLHSSSDRAAFTASSNGGMNLPGLLTWPSFAIEPPRNASRPVREDAR